MLAGVHGTRSMVYDFCTYMAILMLYIYSINVDNIVLCHTLLLGSIAFQAAC